MTVDMDNVTFFARPTRVEQRRSWQKQPRSNGNSGFLPPPFSLSCSHDIIIWPPLQNHRISRAAALAVADDDQQSSVERPQNEKRWSLCRSGYRARRGREGGRRTASFQFMKRRRGRDKAHHHCSRTKRDEGRRERTYGVERPRWRLLPCLLPSSPLHSSAARTQTHSTNN